MRLPTSDASRRACGGGAPIAPDGSWNESLAFCGSLSHNRYDNNVSRILKNVLDRFRTRR